MTIAPSGNGAVRSGKSIKVYSDNKELTLSESILIYLAINTEPSFFESRALQKTRARIHSAKCARDYLLENNLNPILDSFSFEGLRQESK